MQAKTSNTLIDTQVQASASSQSAWRPIVAPWWNAALAVLPVFLLTRAIFVLLTYFGGVLFFVPNYWAGRLGLHDVIDTWYRWDAIRYATIAMRGYTTLDYAAFFPLYPALEHVLYALLHRDILVIGMFISNLAFFGTLIVFYRLVEVECDRATAERAVLYLAIFPTAMFFFAAYNESLFLFFLLLSFYAMRRGSWWMAGLFAGLATLTRSLGLFLVLVFLYEFARQHLPQLRELWQKRRALTGLRLLRDLVPVLLIPLALLMYAYALNVRFHDPLAFKHAQVYWRTGLNFPWVAPLIALRSIFTLSPFTFAIPHDIIELAALGLFSVLLVLCFVGPERLRQDQWSFALFGVLALLFALIFPGIPGPNGIPYDPLPSMQRFVLEIFVGFIMLARLGRRPAFHQAYLLLSLPLLAFFTLQFMTGHWTV
jgi:hypothetical protein